MREITRYRLVLTHLEGLTEKSNLKSVKFKINALSPHSGGRYHAWIMAQALIKTGNQVTYWTNIKPFFTRDFESKKIQNDIIVDVSLNYKLFKRGKFDFVIVVPDSNYLSGLYEKALLSASYSNSKLVLLNFESPNWYNELSPSKRDERYWRGWNIIAQNASLILSSTFEGMKYAVEYYTTQLGSVHEYCYPAINTFFDDDLVDVKKDNSIIIITRFDKNSAHKGGSEIFELFCEKLRGYHFKFIIGMGLDIGVEERIVTLALKFEIRVEFFLTLNDHDKFREIKKSKLMVFPSRFEGFGYPPVESLYHGTRCLVYPLPVFHEVCGDCADYLKSDETISNRVVELIKSDPLPIECIAKIVDKVSFENYGKKLDDIFGAIKVSLTIHKKRFILIKIVAFEFYHFFIRSMNFSRKLISSLRN